MQDRGIGHWRFICVLAFPWRPILSGTIVSNTLHNNRINRLVELLKRLKLMRDIFYVILQPLATQSITVMINHKKYEGILSLYLLLIV